MKAGDKWKGRMKVDHGDMTESFFYDEARLVIPCSHIESIAMNKCVT